MKRIFTFTLTEQRRRDIATALNFFLWLSRRSDVNLNDYETSFRHVIDLMDKVKHTDIGTKISIQLAEFLMIYTSAQYMLKAMDSQAGFEYVNDALGGMNNHDWFEKQKRYFITISRFLIKECETRFEELPEFAKERMIMEGQSHPFKAA